MLTTSDVWCIFDNTAEGAAMENVLALRNKIYGLAEQTRDDVR